MTAKRHHVQRFDRLLSPGASKNEIRCDYACAPYDEAALDMERKWGVNRLPGLVVPAMAEKFGRAIAHLNDCLNREAPEEAAAAAVNCVRGLHAMDAAAVAAGHKPADPEVWQVEFEGRTLVFVRDKRQWPAAQAAAPGATVYSLQEAAYALEKARPPTVADVQAAFPGAQITAVRQRSPLEDDLQDSIPF